MGETGCAVIAADDDERVVQFADFREAGDQQAEGGVEGLGLAEVIGEVFADLGDIG